MTNTGLTIFGVLCCLVGLGVLAWLTFTGRIR